MAVSVEVPWCWWSHWAPVENVLDTASVVDFEYCMIRALLSALCASGRMLIESSGWEAVDSAYLDD